MMECFFHGGGRKIEPSDTKSDLVTQQSDANAVAILHVWPVALQNAIAIFREENEQVFDFLLTKLFLRHPL